MQNPIGKFTFVCLLNFLFIFYFVSFPLLILFYIIHSKIIFILIIKSLLSDKPKRRPKTPKIILTPEVLNNSDGNNGNATIIEGNITKAPSSLDRVTQIKVGDQVIEIDPDNVMVVKELGKGAYGIVELIQHVPSGVRLAVKKIRASNLQDESRLLRDMDVLVKSRGCPTIVYVVFGDNHHYPSLQNILLFNFPFFFFILIFLANFMVQFFGNLTSICSWKLWTPPWTNFINLPIN